MSFCAVKPPGASDYQAIGKQGEWLMLLATVDHLYSHKWGLRTYMLINYLCRSQMSSQLTNLVPVLDGTNYQQWSTAMKSFLMSQGQWKCTKPGAVTPGVTTAEAEGEPSTSVTTTTGKEDLASWNKDTEKAFVRIMPLYPSFSSVSPYLLQDLLS